MAFTIITDTSANLPLALLEEKGVLELPFHYCSEGKDLTCLDVAAFRGAEAKKYYAELKSGMKVSTSQINRQTYIDFMEPFLARGEDLLFISMSSGISGSFASGESAAEELRERFPERKIVMFDTLAASLGEGIAVLRAAECREKGMSLEETVAELSRFRPRLRQEVLLDDLMFLHRGGRVALPKALIGTVLGIRPILKGDEGGRLVVCGKVRGRKRGLSALAEKYGRMVDRSRRQLVCIAYTDCEEDALALRGELDSIFPNDFMVERYEPVTGSYVGPGTVALFYESGDENARSY